MKQHYADLAKKRQKEHGGTAPGKRKNTSGKFAGSESADARDQAGQPLNVSGKSVARRAGKMLTKANKIGHRPEKGSTVAPFSEYLQENNIDKKQAHRWQFVARIPEPRFNCWPFAQTHHGHENQGYQNTNSPLGTHYKRSCGCHPGSLEADRIL